jgi:large subunit ribosomal protein L29
MITKELRELSIAELDQKLRDQRAELVGLRLKKTSGQVENTARFGDLRRDIARLETLKNQKVRAAAVPAVAAAK